MNWHPGHMYIGMQTMIGKLNTVDCVIEVHDARIPFTGRNSEFRHHLGMIKPHLLLLNKSDLADLTRWTDIKARLYDQGDKNILLSDMTGNDFSFASRGYTNLLNKIVQLVTTSNRYNREFQKAYKIMIVGIPNVGKSTLINRLRQYHLGCKGEPAKVGPSAGVTKNVAHVIKVSSRPLIYSIDTPGILAPGSTKNLEEATRLALCSSFNDRVIKPRILTEYLLKYLNETKNYIYLDHYELDKPITTIDQLVEVSERKIDSEQQHHTSILDSNRGVSLIKHPDEDSVCWKFVRKFRKGLFGKIMFD